MIFLFYMFLFDIILVNDSQASESFATRFQQYHVQCKDITKVNDAQTSAVYSEDPVNVAAVGDYLFCLNKKVNIQNDVGDVNVESFKYVLPYFGMPKENIDSAARECTVLRFPTPQRTAFEMRRCIQKYMVIQLPQGVNI
ncbi:unnamed protein product [Phyllotreta striolata]|uniref:Uncharacterized protein n=1 Tax=Phyllotreta striolata TaxID=444603 RepID=A0A9N9TE67_PHYSR|nr:unnamed protein product [Phyllotreta striolata]